MFSLPRALSPVLLPITIFTLRSLSTVGLLLMVDGVALMVAGITSVYVRLVLMGSFRRGYIGSYRL
ncbi:MAG: hypothetical protein HC812_04625 [Leptolyngbya sp. RL_3_1]|nr:hypothetical protein [Leptolyngbya sp. RL_3_1]